MGLFDVKPKFKRDPVIRTVPIPEPKEPRPGPNKKSQASLMASHGMRRSTASTVRKQISTQSLARVGSDRSTTQSESPRASVSPPNRARATLPDRLAVPGAHSSRPPSVAGLKRKNPSAHEPRASPAASDRAKTGLFSGGEDDGEEENWEDLIDPKPTKAKHNDPDRQLAHAALAETLLPRQRDKDGTDGQDTKDDKASHDTKAGKAGGRERPVTRKDDYKLKIIHAKDVASLALNLKPALNAKADEVAIELQYPGSRHRERYELVDGKDTIDPIEDIKATVDHIAHFYLTPKEADPILNKTTGFKRAMARASSKEVYDASMFRNAVEGFNSIILKLHRDGSLARNLSSKHGLPKDIVAFILRQVYDRTVAPKVELLRRYTNGSDNVYGEMLHPFVTSILVDRLHMTSGQVFVDLGSGVGNVVLQAALEIGCESWGCEMMENACNLAEAQKREFAARCRLWGIKAGPVRLERGNFLENPEIAAVLKRADVVLVNNQAFTAELNDRLVPMFLDLKKGCKIVSLKSFILDFKNAYNANDIGSSILDVEHLTYPEGYVSWTNVGGRFCISTRK